jgi:hypothetical protein
MAGIRMGEIAAMAKTARPTLSMMLNGQIRTEARQVAIWKAYKRLSGATCSLDHFWGDLLNDNLKPAFGSVGPRETNSTE